MLQLFGARKRSRSLPQQLDAMLSRCFEPDDASAAIIVTKSGETLFRTAFGLAPALRACGYSHKKPAAPVSMTRLYAAGALVSTVDDLARWAAAISAGKLLSARSWERVFTPFRLNNGRSSTYAHGWGVLRRGPFRAFEHGGAIPGFVTHAIRVPERELFIAVLANDDGGDQNILDLLRVLWYGRVPTMLPGLVTKAAIVAERAAARA